MNPTDKITALRDALTRIRDREYDDHAAHKIARDALTADASEDAPDAERESLLRLWFATLECDALQEMRNAYLAARPAPVAATPAPAARRDIFAICDAYESGIGHGLQLDGHKSGSIFGNPECGKAYEIGYEEGEERARGGKAAAPAAPIGKG